MSIAQLPNEADLLRILTDEVSRRLPPSWRAELSDQQGQRGIDAVLRVTAPDGSQAALPVEAKASVNPRDVPTVLDALRRATTSNPELATRAGPPLVVARYLAPRTREMLAAERVSYADATGNLRLVCDQPAIFIESVGASSDPWRSPDREIKTLKGRPAARVIRALLDFRPPYGVRQLWQLSGTSLASTSRVVHFLDEQALVQRDERGGIADVDWPALLLRWSEDYGFQTTNTVVAGFEPRGTSRVLEALPLASERYAVTGSIAAARVAPVADSRLAMLFADNPERLARELGLRDSGPPNVLIARSFDPVVYERTTSENGITYASVSQTAVDLLTSPGRGPAEGEALIQWMKANEDAWRR
jgi:hypothetical protein